MLIQSRVPLAWLNLTHNFRRLLLSVAGVGFAVVLMFMQVGFLYALFDSQVQMARSLNADILISGKARYVHFVSEPVDRHRLSQARAVPGVAAAYPFFVEIERGLWRGPDGECLRAIRLLAFDPDDPVFLLPEVVQQAELLRVPGTLLFDRKSKNVFGRHEPGTVTQVGARKVKIAGLFTLGADFASEGTGLVSTRTFHQCMGGRRPGGENPDFILVRAAPGTDVPRLIARLKEVLPGDVSVFTKQEFIESEMEFWGTITPIGQMFGMGTLIGFLVGMIICYQILFTEVSDHLPQLATLKAIGYGGGFLIKVILQEAFFLGVLGFLGGGVVALGLYAFLESLTGLRMDPTIWRSALVFVLTIGMCLISGWLAARRVLALDPADLW